MGFFSFTMLLIMLLCSYKNTSAHTSQRILKLPQHHISPADTPGTVIFTRLTNTTGHSITLHPLLTPMGATDSASLVRGILAQLKPSGDTDNIRLQLIRIVGHYIKSPFKESFLPNVRDYNNNRLIKKEYSLTGSEFSFPSWHCDNFCREAIYLLEATKFFADSDFIIQNCGIHTTMQVKLLHGDTIFADMAVGTPVFMVPDPNRRCGYASLSDILNDTTLVAANTLYFYINEHGDSINVAPIRGLNTYQPIFRLPWTLHPCTASKDVLANFSGDFILAPGQSVEYRYTLGYVIDTSLSENKTTIDAAMKKVAYFGVLSRMEKIDRYLDSAVLYLYKPYSDILKIPMSRARVLFNEGKIWIYSSNSTWSPGYLPHQSILYSNIPASADTLYYGVQTSAPLLITDSKYLSGKMATDSFHMAFYGEAPLNAAPRIDDSEFNYANGVGNFIKIPPHTEVRQRLLYNYHILNFYKGGPMFAASAPGILIESSPDTVK